MKLIARSETDPRLLTVQCEKCGKPCGQYIWPPEPWMTETAEQRRCADVVACRERTQHAA